MTLVFNPGCKEIGFLAINNCLLTSSDPKKCDFVLFDDVVFCFVEVKDVKQRQRQGARHHAAKQLESALQLFFSRIDFAGYRVEAIICISAAKVYPAATTGIQAARIRFQDQFGIALLEGNGKVFQNDQA